MLYKAIFEEKGRDFGLILFNFFSSEIFLFEFFRAGNFKLFLSLFLLNFFIVILRLVDADKSDNFLFNFSFSLSFVVFERLISS